MPPIARAGSAPRRSPRDHSTARGAVSQKRLLQRYRGGDLSAREEIVHHYLPLAKRLAGRYRHTTESQDDLEQVASLGLLKAIDRFDPDLGAFERFAVPTILGELKRHFRDKGWGMRVPRSTQERVLELNEAIDVLSSELGRSPTPQDLAGHMGCELVDVVETLDASAAYTPTSLEAPLAGDAGDELALRDRLGGADPGYGLVDLRQTLAPAFRCLQERDQLILKLRFIDDLSQTEIAERVGISQMHVSRLLRRSLDHLAAAAEGYREVTS